MKLRSTMGIKVLLVFLLLFPCVAFAEVVGNTTTGSSHYEFANTWMIAGKLQGNSTIDGTLSNVTITLSNQFNDTGRYFQLALFSHNSTSNTPDSLVPNSVMLSTSSVLNGQDITLTPNATVTISKDTQYWIVIQSNTSIGFFYFSSGGKTSWKPNGGYGNWPPWNGTEDLNNPWVMGKGYITVTSSGVSTIDDTQIILIN